MKKDVDSKIAIAILVVLSMAVAVYVFVGFENLRFSNITEVVRKIISRSSFTTSEVEGITNFSSEEEFQSWLQEADLDLTSFYGSGLISSVGRRSFSEEIEMTLAPKAIDDVDQGDGESVERVSETNVQVEGIDEPDIVKTDGEKIYLSSGRIYYPVLEKGISPSHIGGVDLVNAFPPQDLEIDSEIDRSGEMLLADNNLVIFSGGEVLGYDVSDAKNPVKEWNLELKSRTSLVGARLYNNKVYLVTKTNIDNYHPCPIRPLSIEGIDFEVSCDSIYHPVRPVSVDVTYDTFVLNPATGEIEKSISFVGSSGQSIVYMSQEGIYVTYYYYGDFINFMSDFFKEECKDIIPQRVIDKLDKLEEYDISRAAKMTEFKVIIDSYFNSLDDDERLKAENNITNRMNDYYKKHKRELERTGIIRIDLDDFGIAASGNVPGRPLNQFSLDEYQGNLRIAVTVGDGWSIIGNLGDSTNDVYILNNDLKIKGFVTDLGLTERIYSVRFIKEMAYLVTFRQVDPFYVLDLSDIENPEVKGELKIPGYSSYLHPITENRILGIGKEGSQVKISLFDVSSPEDPKEIDKYLLKEYWSDILNTHHAFLLDEKHEVFFLPGSQGGYVFSYQGDFLDLERAVSGINARRAIYINDYLYVIGNSEIIVLNEEGWEEINNLEL
jgi:uncharacterized secreted protein with C-terminal beta-propeller domain